MKHILRSVALVLIVVAVCIPGVVRADVAPPSPPPGFNPEPGNDGTQVRMMSETVLMDIMPGDADQAKVTANFTMHNLGSDAESMAVRFPISANDGFGRYPEIMNLSVKVNGKTVSTRRIMEADPIWGSDLVPWAEFNVTFPSGEDVQIQVTYTVQGTVEASFVSFNYIFHTGAGWNDTIGSADMIVHLPYEANEFNVILDESTGFSLTTSGGVFDGNDVKWHFDNLEPTYENDFEVSLVAPFAWQKVLKEKDNLEKNPNDGESWGRLGKLYKEMFLFRRGFRHDAGGQQLYQMGIEAYEKAVTLLPDDALWHAGFSDLLGVHAYYASQEGEDATAEMLRSMQEIHLALDLSPDDPKVKEIAETIYYLFPDAIKQYERGYDFLWLTATPDAPTSTPTLAEPTFTPPATIPPLSTVTAVPAKEAEPTPAPAPSTGNPLCGSAALIPFGLILLAFRKRYS